MTQRVARGGNRRRATLGNHIGDIGAAVQAVVEAAGFSVVRDLVGHGIGVEFHEEPQVPNYGKPKRREKLVPGLTIAIEPMVNIGGPATKTLADRWTIVTLDGSLSAHFEHTVAITETGPLRAHASAASFAVRATSDRPFWRVLPEAKLSRASAPFSVSRRRLDQHPAGAAVRSSHLVRRFGCQCGNSASGMPPVLPAADRVRGRHGECAG